MDNIRDIIKFERAIGDRILTLFVSKRHNEDGYRFASIDLQRGSETIWSFNVPVESVDTFAKAAAYFSATEALFASQEAA